ncbi:uncharacterized protein BDW47DRAFT_65233 [Aspergillus candidus]|uniref:Uncharacterized protein n=1 Tax=Aspergillus candidus TaxID=41067 RepID=A0A2I2FKN5_ASPCN|nr:hypothetical protein BDW47DRAFT_65233 [Aspergillus candidus]PLB41197.1 hypothetical protein BDW47DRAFT_65233 [Aspergillus candidus]
MSKGMEPTWKDREAWGEGPEGGSGRKKRKGAIGEHGDRGEEESNRKEGSSFKAGLVSGMRGKNRYWPGKCGVLPDDVHHG